MLKKLIFLTYFLSGVFSLVQAQAIQWTAFENLNDSLRIERKPLMVFIHTDWCKYCDMQENIVFQKKEISDRLSTDFYCLRLDAESKEDIKFLNREYSSEMSSGYHELAEYLGEKNDQLIFPTTVLLNQQLQMYARLQGLHKEKVLLVTLSQ